MKKICFYLLLLVFSNTVLCQEISLKDNLFIGISDFTEFLNYFNNQDVKAIAILGIYVNEDISVIAQFEDAKNLINDETDEMMFYHLGLRFNIFNDYYAQLNFHNLFSDLNSNHDTSISIGAFYHLDWMKNYYIDPSVRISHGTNDFPAFNFSVGLGLLL